MDRQDLLLEQADGRYCAIDKVGTGLGSIATTENLSGEVVSFGLPSSPGLFLNLAHRYYLETKDVVALELFDKHDQGIWPDHQGPLFDFLEKVLAHIVFSFSAIEAYANEVIGNTDASFTYTVKRKSGTEETLNKDDTERWVGLDEKLDKVLPLIMKCSSPKGTQLWTRYREIKKLRDRLIHLKSVDRTASGPDVETIWGDLLRVSAEPFCNQAHDLIGHYVKIGPPRRWFTEYPFIQK